MNRIVILLAFLAATAGAASAQGTSRVHVRGTVVSLQGDDLRVDAADGSTSTILLAPTGMVSEVVKTDAAALKAGAFVGAAAEPLPDGTLKALEVHIFPPGRAPAIGSQPYDLSPTSSMTNAQIDTIDQAKVDNTDGLRITVSYPGGSKTILIAPSTPIVTFVPGERADLVPGAHVIVNATRGSDGTLSAMNVVVGKNGLVPPM